MKKIMFDITPQGPYFSVIRSAIWQTPLDTSGWHKEVDWTPIIQNYDDQAILPLVAPVLIENNAIIGLTNEKINYILDCVADNVRKHYKIREVCKQVIDLLESNGLKPILIKGESIAARYPQPNLRAVGDIDLYLGIEGANAARQVLIPICEKSVLSGDHTDNYWICGVEVEIHRRFGHSFDYRHAGNNIQIIEESYICQGLPNLRNSNCKMTTVGSISTGLLESQEVFFNFTHLVKHLLTGEGIRQFCDLAKIITDCEDKCSWGELRDKVIEIKLSSIWNLIIMFLVEYLGLSMSDNFLIQEIKVSHSDLMFLSDWVVGSCEFGRSRPLLSFRNDGFFKALLAFDQRARFNRRFFKSLYFSNYQKLVSALLKVK